MANTIIRTYVFDDSFSYFVPSLWGGEHTFKTGGGISWNRMDPRTTVDSGRSNSAPTHPYNPDNAATYPFQFDITVGPVGVNGFDVYSRDRRYYFFAEDKWRVCQQRDAEPRAALRQPAADAEGHSQLRPAAGLRLGRLRHRQDGRPGGVGKFYDYVPVVLDLTHQQIGVVTQFPTITDQPIRNNPVLRPDMITDSAGNLGVAAVERSGPGRDRPA